MTDETDILIETTPDESAEDGGPSAISTLGLQRMSLQELKEKSPTDLLAFAEALDFDLGGGQYGRHEGQCAGYPCVTRSPRPRGFEERPLNWNVF